MNEGNMHIDEFGLWSNLLRDLRGRPAQFIRQQWLDSGRVCWDVTLLPRVFVAPDVFGTLIKRPGTTVDYTGAQPCLTLTVDQ